MKDRKRKAHFRIVDDQGKNWHLSWAPKENVLRVRRKSDRTTLEVTAAQLLIFVRLRGTVGGTPLRPDVAQLAFA
jgi:hypothetical protein